MFVFFRYLVILLIVSVNVFAANNAFSAAPDRILLIHELPQTDGYIENMIIFNSRIFFLWNDSSSSELWISDGTENGTKIIKNFPGYNPAKFITKSIEYESWPGNGSSTPIILNGSFFFTVGNTLWKSNGTAVGTVLIKNINWPGDGFAVLNNIIYMLDMRGSLWRSDGSSAGTWQVASFRAPVGRELVVFKDKLYLAGNDPAHDSMKVSDTELWVSDGTAAGTKLFVDIMPFDKTVCCGIYCSDTCTDSSSWPGHFIVHNNTMYFSADDGVHGKELWKSDGTRAGTVLVKDIWPGSRDSSITKFVSVDNNLIFGGDDGVHGSELWGTDGSRNGTTLLKDLVPGAEGSDALEQHLTGKMNDEIYFSSWDGSSSVGGNLWKTDGTSKGTKLVKYGSRSGWPRSFVYDGRLFFSGYSSTNGDNEELWVTDGTSSGTYQFRDILPGVDEYGNSLSSYPDNFVTVGDFVLFKAYYGIYYDGGYWYYKTGIFKLNKGKSVIAPVLPLLISDWQGIE